MENTTYKTYLLSLLAITLLVGLSAQKSEALESQINAGVSFVQSLSLAAQEIEFGTLTFSTDATANDVVLGTDGSLTCSNNNEYTCPQTGKAGELTVAGALGGIVDVSCGSIAKLSNGTQTLDLEQIKLMNNGTEVSCLGINSPALSFSLLGDAEQDLLKMGAKLVIPDEGISDVSTYSTSAANGEAIAIRIAYQ